jgi:hypothetical protein
MGHPVAGHFRFHTMPLAVLVVMPPGVDDPIAWVKTVFRDIRARAQVLEVIGDF